jgi:hypothetical protein
MDSANDLEGLILAAQILPYTLVTAYTLASGSSEKLVCIGCGGNRVSSFSDLIAAWISLTCLL